MTILQLKKMLSRYPDDWKVVLNTSSDYEEYSEANGTIPCEMTYGICGISINMVSSRTPDVNAILLTA